MSKLALIFDLDGTLWDSRKQVAKAWNNVLNQLDHNIKYSFKDFSNIMGLSNAEILDHFKNQGIDNKDILLLCQQEELNVLSREGAILYPDVFDVIKSLNKKYDLYIVSNCQNGYIEAFLNYYKLNKYFKDFLCSDNIYKNKKECLNTLLINNNIKNFYYIGDTNGDFNATKSLKGNFIFANYGFEKIKNPPQKINKFSDLLDLFK